MAQLNFVQRLQKQIKKGILISAPGARHDFYHNNI